MAIQHEFICIDEGHATLLHINELDQSKNWLAPIGQPAARDMQLIGDGKILIGHHHGYSEFDIALGRLVKEFKSLEGVTAVRRQPSGHTIIAGVDIAEVVGQASCLSNFGQKNDRLEACPTKLKGVVVLELDKNDTEIHRAIFP